MNPKIKIAFFLGFRIKNSHKFRNKNICTNFICCGTILIYRYSRVHYLKLKSVQSKIEISLDSCFSKFVLIFVCLLRSTWQLIDKSTSEKMDDCISIDSSSDEEVSQDYNFSHNNNGSFTEHKVLSTKQVYALMEDEIKKVQDVVTKVSFTWILCNSRSINQMFTFSAFWQQNAASLERVQMGRFKVARGDSRRRKKGQRAYECYLRVYQLWHTKNLRVPNLHWNISGASHQQARM